ncbi:MAG TPA: zf-HC2 domain-containing protein [Kofleriaceae bacterium]
MVATGEACPTDETLAAFAHRRLTPVEHEGVAGHLDDCESCRLAVRIGAKGTPPESLEVTLPAASGPVTIGGQLGRYQVKRLLGSGGMARSSRRTIPSSIARSR